MSIIRHQSINVAGTTGTLFTIDLTSAPVPDRRYAADIATVVRVNDMVRLIFGQTKVGGIEPRSLVVIHLSALAVRQFLQSMPDVLATMRAYAQQSNLTKVSLVDVEKEPNQTVALAANITAASASGREACMDFYYTSPFVMLQVTKGGGFAVDPVVRVMLSTGLLLAICERLESMKADLPNETVEAQK